MNISDVSKKTGLSTKTIRFYEAQGLIKTAGRAGNGYRIYTETHLMQLSVIKRARDLGFSLQESKVLLDLVEDGNRRSADVKEKVLVKIENLEQQISALTSSRDLLLSVADQCPGDDNAVCPILEALQGSRGDAADNKSDCC